MSRAQTQTPIRVALAGNPNSGKTSLFNALTGGRQHVGNYPGVTVEKRTGLYTLEGQEFEVSDLPGTYSMSSYTPEERVAQDDLLEQDHDVVVVVVDSTTLSRSLVLLVQMLQLDPGRLVLCLNMADEAARSGQQLDLDLLRRLLNIPVVETVGHRGEGIDGLKQAVRQVTIASPEKCKLTLSPALDHAIAAVAEHLTAVDRDHRAWVATKLLLQDPLFVQRMNTARFDRALQEAQRQRVRLEAESGRDVALFVMERYHGFVDGLLRQVTLRAPHRNARLLSDGIDAVLVHRLFGLPFFFAVMYGIFWLTFTVGEYPMGWIEAGFAWLGTHIASLWPPGADSPLRSLLVDGIIAGVGGVVVFLPNILLLFLGLALVEDTGYMARAAFLMDRLMHRFGLHGRSFVPMMVGFGCSVPGIMATRTLEHEHDRLATMLVLPLMSCGARLTIWMLLIPAFFAPAWRASALWAIYATGIVLALALALLLRRTVLSGEDAPFVMELPPYRMPTARAVTTRMMQRSWLYLRKAGTVILAISIVMWFITSYPRTLSAPRSGGATGAAQLEGSIAGHIGKAMDPALRPLGLDWKVGTALIGAFAAKEVFVAQLGIIYAVGHDDGHTLRQQLRRDYSPRAGFALMLFLLIATPCMATLAVTRRESGSWKWALLQLGGLTTLGYVVALVFYQLSRLAV